jgi:hypothetical protein
LTGHAPKMIAESRQRPGVHLVQLDVTMDPIHDWQDVLGFAATALHVRHRPRRGGLTCFQPSVQR